MTLNKFLIKPSDKVSQNFVEKSRRFVTMCLNKIAGQMELTGPQISAYILGLDDHYTPNKFVLIYLNTFEIYLTKRFQIREELFETTIPNDLNNDDADDSESEQDRDVDNEMFKIVNSNGKITAVNLRVDYMYRGKQLENMCLYDYAATIHKVKVSDKELDKLARQENREG